MKLYVLIRQDLSRSQKIVQAVHASTELILSNGQGNWDNGTVVCLKVRDEKELLSMEKELKEKGVVYSSFREPDTGNDMTALALIGEKNLFKDLTLV